MFDLDLEHCPNCGGELKDKLKRFGGRALPCWRCWIIVLTTLLQLAACTKPPWPCGSIEELYPQTQNRPELRTVRAQGLDIQVAQTAGSRTTPIVFVHGSPGGWKAWARFLDTPALAAFGPRLAMDQDPLVDPRTADYLEQPAPSDWMRVERLPGKDHFFLWKEPLSVVRQIDRLDCNAR